MATYHVDDYFDLSQVPFKSLFEGLENVWDVIPLIGSFFEKKAYFRPLKEIPYGVYVLNPESIFVGAETIIEPGAYICGPCIIGNHCIVRHGAYIRGNFICGDHCVIGHATEIKNSIFLNHTHAAHFNYVGDSVLGNGVNLGAGTILANLKLRRDEVFVMHEEKKIHTGLKKFGAILGDGVQTGCNTVTNPGTLMGKGSFCFANTTVSGVVEEGQKVKIWGQRAASKGF